MMRAIFILAPLPALLFFPAPFFYALVLASALAFPPAGVLYGLLADALYFAPGAAAVPYGIVYGTGATLIGFLVSRFFKERVTGFSA